MKRRTPTLADQIKKSAETEPEQRVSKPPAPSRCIPTGSTLLNCTCADNPWGGWGKGKLVNLIGDSSSGKSFLALTTLAEAAYDDQFKYYRLIYDESEHASEFDFHYLFGPKVEKRIEIKHSRTIKDYNKTISKLINGKDPFIHIEDSFDDLTSDEELARLVLMASESKKKGTYGQEKVKGLNQSLREMCEGLEKLSSMSMIISQVKDKIGASFPMKTRTGGNQLKHNSTHELWMHIAGPETSKDMQIGVKSRVRVTKNKLTGKGPKGREVDFSIYYDYGIDDIGSCVDWLAAQHWEKKKGSDKIILAKELGLEGIRRRIIRQIERRELEHDLRELVGKVWMEREQELKLKRKPRYE